MKKKDEAPAPGATLDLLARLIAEEVRQGRAPAPVSEDRPKVEITCVPAPRRARK